MSPLNITDTNSVNDSPGRAFGLEGNNFIYLLVALLLALAVYLGGTAVLHQPAAPILVISGLLFTVPLAYILLLRSGKPKGYARDWLAQRISGGHFSASGHSDDRDASAQ